MRVGILELVTEAWSDDRWRSKFKFSGQMTERGPMKKQSLCAGLLLVQFLGSGQSRGRFGLCRQAGRSSRKQTRESKHSYNEHSYFQGGFILVLQSSFGPGIEPGRTFCTATSLKCQEIRYAIRSRILNFFVSRCKRVRQQIV